MSDATGAITAWGCGVITAALIYTVAALIWGSEAEVVEPDCYEDAVYAWQQNAGDFPDDVTWACVSLDDLFLITRGQ